MAGGFAQPNIKNMTTVSTHLTRFMIAGSISERPHAAANFDACQSGLGIFHSEIPNVPGAICAIIYVEIS